MLKRLITVSLLLLVALATRGSAASGQGYTVTDLGTLGGKVSAATAVNSLGQIAGYADASDGERAFFWTKAGGMQALPSLGSNPADFASAINDGGAVVGLSRLTPSGPSHAFLWTSSGGIQDLRTLPGDTYSSASGINSAGHVVGPGEERRNSVWKWRVHLLHG